MVNQGGDGSLPFGGLLVSDEVLLVHLFSPDRITEKYSLDFFIRKLRIKLLNRSRINDRIVTRRANTRYKIIK